MTVASRETRSETLNSLQAQLRIQALRSVMFHSAVSARLGVVVTDFSCINLLNLDGPLTPGELARRLGLTRGGAVTAMVDRLERAGFVRRVRDASDRRRVLVQLDEAVAGASVAPYFTGLGEDLDSYLAGYTDAELALLLRFNTDVNDLVARATDALRDDVVPPR